MEMMTLEVLRTMSPYVGEAKGLVMNDRNIKSSFGSMKKLINIKLTLAVVIF